MPRKIEEFINKIHCEKEGEFNCLKQIPDGSIDLIVTSPPYDNLRIYKANNEFSFNFQEIAKELFRILKIGGVCVWIIGDATVKGSETGKYTEVILVGRIGKPITDYEVYINGKT